MPNSLCREIGHAWRPMTIAGWFRCARVGCGAYAVCTSCVLSVPQGASVFQCDQHQDVQLTRRERKG